MPSLAFLLNCGICIQLSFVTGSTIVSTCISFCFSLCSDIEKIQAGIGDKVAVFLQYFSTFVAGYIIAFAYSWKLALVVASVLPVIAFLSGIIATVRP